MPTFKNIRIKKRGGGTRLQRVQVLASGKYKFVKNLVKGKGKTTSKGKGRSASKVSNVGNKGTYSTERGREGLFTPLSTSLTLLSLVKPPFKVSLIL